MRLSQYHVNIEYLKGKDNVIADALSRVSPQPTPKKGENEGDFMLTEEIPADSSRLLDLQRLRSAQRMVYCSRAIDS